MDLTVVRNGELYFIHFIDMLIRNASQKQDAKAFILTWIDSGFKCTKQGDCRQWRIIR